MYYKQKRLVNLHALPHASPIWQSALRLPFPVKKVINSRGQHLGLIVDVVAELVEPYPIVTGLILKVGTRNSALLPWENVLSIGEDACVANISPRDLLGYKQHSHA